jgi:hypothetical protein
VTNSASELLAARTTVCVSNNIASLCSLGASMAAAPQRAPTTFQHITASRYRQQLNPRIASPDWRPVHRKVRPLAGVGDR